MTERIILDNQLNDQNKAIVAEILDVLKRHGYDYSGIDPYRIAVFKHVDGSTVPQRDRWTIEIQIAGHTPKKGG